MFCRTEIASRSSRPATVSFIGTLLIVHWSERQPGICGHGLQVTGAGPINNEHGINVRKIRHAIYTMHSQYRKLHLLHPVQLGGRTFLRFRCGEIRLLS